MVKNNKLVADLQALIGKNNVAGNIFERASYGQDTSGPDLEPEKIPAVVVQPESASQVAAVVRYASTHRLPVYIHGGGTAFKGSPRPKYPDSILLSLRALTFFELHEEDLYFEVGAGFNQYQLEGELASCGYLLPMNIGSKHSSTIGGAVAVNTIGHMVDICMGKIIDHVMGLEVVLPNGEIIETGTRSIRRPAGIDYTRFFAGAEGVFGVITKVRMRLLPLMKKAYILGFFPQLTDIAHAFMRLYREKLPPPLYGELLDKEACQGPFKLRDLKAPKGHMALAIAIGYNQEEADRQAKEIVRVFRAESAIEAKIITSAQEQKSYWDARDNILNILHARDFGERMYRVGSLEATVPLSHLADFIEYLKVGHNYSLLHEAKLFIYGHVGTCDLHGMWVAPESWPASKMRQCAKDTIRLETEINLKWGCASGEIGQTASRIPFLKKRYGEAAYEMLMNFKKAIDPHNILNPGNLEGE
jgi:glycolate oxidase